MPAVQPEPRPARWCGACRSRYRADFARCPIDGGVLEELDRDPLIGEVVGAHYVIDAVIGEGAMARVYRAHHALLAHKQFAVKVMVGDLAATLEMRLRFAQEADSVSQLHHPNVVSVVDFGKTDEGLIYIAMDLVDGVSLAQVIADEAPLPAERVLAIARQIALGLGHAHERGLVHRDLKPDNVIISASPELVRIVDFGLAIPIDDEASTRLTGIGLAVGTPVYAAPEQCLNEPIDHRADLYALGVTMYEMLSGVAPFDGGVVELVHDKVQGVLPSIATRAGVEVPAAVEAIVRRLLRRSPNERFERAGDVVAAIDEAVAAGTRQAAEVVALPVPPRRASSGRTAVIAGASVGMLAVVAVVVGLSLDRGEPPRVVMPDVAVAAAFVHEAAPPAPRPAPVPVPAPAPARAPTPARVETTSRPKVALRAISPRTASAVKHHVAITEPAAPSVPSPQSASEPEPAPLVEAPPASISPPVASPAQPPAPSPPAPAPVWTTAKVRVAGLVVRGSLSNGDVAPAMTRDLPALAACYKRAATTRGASPAATVRVSLSFDDSRRAGNVHASSSWPQLAQCVTASAEELRVPIAPDVGTVDVVVDFAFQPVAP